MFRKIASPLLLVCFMLSATGLQAQSTPHTLNYAPGKSITLYLPAGFDINVAASGLRRVRFFAQSPDGRIFATGMYNLADNTNGSVYILDSWNAQTHTFARVTHYIDHLRNPNNLAFWTDPATQQTWLYVPLTDKLLRYKYNTGDAHPSGAPEVLMRFPDYGLNYKYGGWHLTRTVALATLHGHTRVYLTAGSSCNYCQEHEVVRAAAVSMNPDGSDQQLVARGLRNAVDLKFIPDLDGGSLFASNMGDDHLGDKLPEDTFFELDSNEHPGPIVTADKTVNYGWPTCYFGAGKPIHDTTPLPALPKPGDTAAEADHPTGAGPASHSIKRDKDSAYGEQKGVAEAGTNLTAGGDMSVPDPNAALGRVAAPLADCKGVPAAYTTFAAHSSPLGFVFFSNDNPKLHGSFLIALHGSGHPHIGTGYRIAQFTPTDRTAHDFITGFMTKVNGKPTIHGRPCGMLRLGPDSFLLTDDHLGLVYYIRASG